MNLETIKNLNLFKDELLDLEKLKNQGFNNINYLLKTSNKSYIVRVFKSFDSVNISREFEFLAQQKAWKKIIASKAIFLNNDFMIYEYTKGIHKTKLEKEDLKNLISKIKKIHKIKLKTPTYDLDADLNMYRDSLKDDKSKKLIKESFKSLKKLKKEKIQLGLVHHDLNPKNIIFTKDNIKIIDWEYAGTNDIFFDLATICIEFNLSNKQEKLLVDYYFPKKKSFYTIKLMHYKIIYKNLCKLWFLKNIKLD